MTDKQVNVRVVIAVQPDGSWSACGEKSQDLDWHIRSLSDGVKPGTTFHYASISLLVPPKPRAEDVGRLTLGGNPAKQPAPPGDKP